MTSKGIFLFVCAFCSAAQAAPDPELTSYQPEKTVTGVIRCWGCREMAPVLRLWQDGFRHYHPDLWISAELKGTATAMLGLEENVAELALMDRPIAPYDTYGIWRRSHLLPVAVTVAMGSLDVPQHASALGIFVQRDNPITQLTLRQLDEIFGAQRTGGWRDMEWDTGAARSAATNIRTWGQLGLTGAWASASIRPYGPPALHPGGMSFFQQRVLGGADTRNEAYCEYPDPRDMLAALSHDRFGIACAEISAATAEVRLLAIADRDDGPFVLPSKATITSGAYPLARAIYICFAPDTAGGDKAKIDPKVREFMRYILSREGQEAVARDGNYLPLTAAVARAQLQKIN